MLALANDTPETIKQTWKSWEEYLPAEYERPVPDRLRLWADGPARSGLAGF